MSKQIIWKKAEEEKYVKDIETSDFHKYVYIATNDYGYNYILNHIHGENQKYIWISLDPEEDGSFYAEPCLQQSLILAIEKGLKIEEFDDLQEFIDSALNTRV